ncbi:hypothetical protein BDN72DRAFT_838326 [Pluteus cervinus]|uniref:Uncharacterized protein n=1 Tax=Pluteus cervinus TaxID=181527 RepID=A0ACD3B008_9AGAR|nr:hypothetical protein BDN72DRAFT_838326 [Pluteus cervinus]
MTSIFKTESSARYSTSSLPSYIAPSLQRTPSYTAEPQEFEQRLARVDYRPLPSGIFTKQSKNGDLRLKLNAQEDKIPVPVYSQGAMVAGTLEVKPGKVVAGIIEVDVKVNGRLKLKEMGEGGTQTVKLCLAEETLWRRSGESQACPESLPFRLQLPLTFDFGNKKYLLPPTYDVKLSGLPGFTASIDYSVTATINTNSPVSSLVKSKAHIHIGETSVSTPFTYIPRNWPSVPLPAPISIGPSGFPEPGPEWSVWTSEVIYKDKRHQGGNLTPPPSLVTHFYLPASRTFYMKEPIPFFFKIESSAQVLAAYLPFAPSAVVATKQATTRVQLLRQSTIDVVRNGFVAGDARTDMWRIENIGEGGFRPAVPPYTDPFVQGEGHDVMCFSGEITISPALKNSGFRAAGLSLQDCVLLSITPPEGKKCPFAELRQIIPVKLTTDAWMADGRGIGAGNVIPTGTPSEE